MDQQFSGLKPLKKLDKKTAKPDNYFREINKSIILNKEGSVIGATPSEKNYNHIHYKFFL